MVGGWKIVLGSDIQMQPAPWFHWPHCPSCHQRLYSDCLAVLEPVDGHCPHCLTELKDIQ